MGLQNHAKLSIQISGFPWKLEMKVEKSWNIKKWPKVMEFCDQSWNFTNFVPELYRICILFGATKIFSTDLESLHFLMFSLKRRECKIGKTDGHGKSRNGYGKVMEKCFVNSVGTLRMAFLLTAFL